MSLDALGGQFVFYMRALAAAPRGLYRHWRTVLGHLAALLPSGLAVIAVTAAATGLVSAVPAPGGASGLIAAIAGTREIAPLVTAIVLSLTVGCRFTVELGAARAVREDEALEAIGARAISYLVATRLLAGLSTVLPLYACGLLGGYTVARLLATGSLSTAPTGYDAYTALFLSPSDVLWSAAKALLLGAIVLLVHCYYGYAATRSLADGAPAVAHALRSSLVAVAVADAAFALAVWAPATPVGVLG